MKYSKNGVEFDDIAMAPFCEHDCLHTHTRWGIPDPKIPLSNKGFDGRAPHQIAGAPLVPANQTVFISLTTPSSCRYRAVARGPIRPGTFSVFNHHGSGYALAIDAKIVNWLTFGAAQSFVKAYAIAAREPYVRIKPGFLPIPPFFPFPEVSVEHVDPTESSAAFYHRLQFSGTNDTDKFEPRIKIENLALCRSK